MAATKANSIVMTEGRPLPQIIRFSVPLALTGILQLLFNAADVIVVGKFDSSTALPPSARQRRLSTCSSARSSAFPSASTSSLPVISAVGMTSASPAPCTPRSCWGLGLASWSSCWAFSWPVPCSA